MSNQVQQRKLEQGRLSAQQVADTTVVRHNDAEPTTLNQESTPTEAFRLMDLPPELRCHIYSFILPQNMTITFEKGYRVEDDKPVHLALGLRKGEDVALQIGGPSSYKETEIRRPGRDGCRMRCWKTLSRPKYTTVETQLFRVSKIVRDEAQGILYGTNTYKFAEYGNAPELFGSLDHPARLGLVRMLQKICIEVMPGLDTKEHWCMKRLRSRMEYFVNTLKEHADDQSQKSLLRELKIEFKLPAYFSGDDSGRIWNMEKFMFGLESLASLRGIKDVRFTGLPEWYARCMQLLIQGKGGEVQETDWPLVRVTRYRSIKKSWYKTKRRQWGNTRKWYQPTLDWKEYAVRNNVPIPDDIDKFWVAAE